MKSVVDVLIANKTISDAGLQGRTIAPKKIPNKNELISGFFKIGEEIFGIKFEKLKLKIRNKLTIPKIPNAIGEIIDIAFVKEASRIFVKINPTMKREVITPSVTNSPSLRKEYLLLGPICPARYAKNPGYSGRTQTAPRGTNNPAKKEIKRLTNINHYNYLSLFLILMKI